MNDYLKTYRIELLTLSPIFIGGEKSLNKKEYVKKGRTIYIPDLEKMYLYMSEHRLAKSFEKFMLDETARDLGRWMNENKIPVSDYEKWTAYKLDASDALGENSKTLEIKSFVKDAYGCPYIPGSSLKGALRTILQAYIIKNNIRYFTRNSEDIKLEAETFRGKPKEYLKNQDKKLSTRTFNSLNRKEDLKNAVNDIMSCVRVSDSQPLSTDSLILCQKVDVSVRGNENPINTTRECIRPNTKIVFDLTITNEFPFSVKEIQEAVGIFAESYYQNFFRFFNKATEVQAPKSDTIWIGGGVGYVSKTVMYPLFGYQKGLKVVSEIMKRTAPQKRDEPNKHRNDFKIGVSPHMLKCTYSQGKLYEFGRCKIKIY